MDGSGEIWMNGRFVPWAEANVHVLTHGLHYGTGVFEGTRAYATDAGPALFRHREHTRRLFDSAALYQMELPFSQEQLMAATRELVRRNGLDACYVRTLVYRGAGKLGVSPSGSPVDVAIAAWPWGPYLG